MTFDNAASYQEIEVSSQPLLVPAIPKNHQCNVCNSNDAFEIDLIAIPMYTLSKKVKGYSAPKVSFSYSMMPLDNFDVFRS